MKYYRIFKVVSIAGIFTMLVFPLLSSAVFCGAGKNADNKAIFAIPNPFGKCDEAGGPATQGLFGGLAGQIISIALLVAGSIAVIYLIVGAYRYITAHGNEEQTESAKNTMKAAIWGLIILIMASAIITIISKIVIEGATGV